MSEIRRYADPKTDYAFKILFAKEEILKDFLNHLFAHEKIPQIVELTHMNPEAPYPVGGTKRPIFDIKVTDETGRVYIIEMQSKSFKNLKKRIQYYGAFQYSVQLNPGDEYDMLLPVVVVSIVNEVCFPEKT
jgi:predicted transposase/invertase (TIGR01784 family)